MKKLLLITISVLFFSLTKAQPGCPQVNAGVDKVLPCGTNCTNLTATYFNTGASTSYAVQSIPYTPQSYTAGTIVPGVPSDDMWSPVINLPFNFCFFGVSYNKIVVGANGIITFDQTVANSPNDWDLTTASGVSNIPTTTVQTNSIMGPYHDIDPSKGGDIKYQIIGTAPCRMFVVSYYQVPMYEDFGGLPCNNYLASHQIVLYETTNAIDVYIGNKPTCSDWNDGLAILGIQNAAGTVAYTVSGRNRTVWTASNEGWRFLPNGASTVSLEWFKNGLSIGTGTSVNVCTGSAASYTVKATYANCDGSNVVVQDNVNVTLTGLQANLDSIKMPKCPGDSTGGIYYSIIGGSAGTTYSWSPNVSSSPTATNLPAGTYVFTVVDAGCTRIDTQKIQSLNPLTVSLPDSLIPNCSPASKGGLKANPSGGTPGYTYIWSNSLGTTQSVGNLSPGTYTVTVKDANNCTVAKSANVNLSIPIVSAGADKTICAGQSVVLNGSATVQGGNGNATFSASPNIAIPDGNATGVNSTIAVSGINPATVGANPIVSVCLNIAHGWDADLDIYLICPGGTQIQLSTDNGGSNDNYVNTCFSPTATTNITAGTAPFTGSFLPEQPFSNLNGCNINGTWTLKVVDDLSGTTGTFQNWSITFNNTNSISSTTWSPTTNMTGSSTLTPTVNPATTTDYVLAATDAKGCTSIDTVRVIVTNANAGADQNVNCYLTGSATMAAVGTGTWTGLSSNPGTSVIANTTNATTTISSFSTFGTFQYTWGNGTCVDTVSIIVGNNCGCPNPPDISLTLSSKSICANKTDTIAGTFSGSATSATVQTSGTGTFNTTTFSLSPFSVIYTPSAVDVSSGSVTLFFISNNPLGSPCKPDTAIYTLTLFPMPVLNAGIDTSLNCIRTNVLLNAVSSVAGTSFVWSNGINTANNLINSPGTYAVVGTANGCVGSDTVIVTQNIIKPISNAGADKLINCYTPTTTIGTNSTINYTYSWTPTAGLSSSTVSNPTATPSATTNYIVTTTDTTNGCTSSDTVVVTVNKTAPISNAGTDKIINCSILSVGIGTAATANYTYSWTPTAGLSSSTISNPTATPSATTTYIVTTTDTTNGCTSSDTVIVTINKTKPISNAGTDKTINCSVLSVGIGTTATANYTYSWMPTTGLSSTTVSNPTATPTATTTYIVNTIDTSNGCTSSDTVVVSVNKTIPVSNAGADKLLNCYTPTTTIGTNSTINYTYSWTPTAGLSSSAVSNPTATPSATTNYIVTTTDTTNGCTSSDTILLTVNKTAPISNAGTDKIINCSILSVGIGTAATANYTYSWTPATGLSSSTISNPTATPSATTTYIVTTTDTTNGCTSSDTIVVTVNKTAPISNAGIDKTINCSVLNVGIGTAATANYTYSWTPTADLSSSTISNPTATPTATTTYIVNTIDTSNSCTSSDTVVVSVNKTIPISNAGADKLINCFTPTTTIGTSSTANYTYSWTPTAGLSSSAVSNPTATPSATTNYIVTTTDTTNGCTSSDTILLTVNKTAPISNAGTDKIINCSVLSVGIGTAATANYIYSWTPATGLSSSTISNPTATPSATTTYIVTTTDTTNGCSSSDTVIVNVNKTAPILVMNSTPAHCISDNATATVHITGDGPFVIHWSNNTTDSIITGLTDALYAVTVTDSKGCIDSAFVNTIRVQDTITISLANKIDVKCYNQSNGAIYINVVGGTPNYQYRWTGNATTYFTQDITNINAGVYAVVVTDTNGCVATFSDSISQPTLLEATTAIVNPPCHYSPNGSATVTANGGIQPYTYLWSNGARDTATTLPDGVNYVTVTDANNCTAIAVANIVRPIPAAIEIIPKDTSLDLGKTVILVSTFRNYPLATINAIRWSPENGLSCNDCVAPTVTTYTDQTYTVYYTYNNGCVDTQFATINIENNLPIFIPNVFSPNGDGNNDVFMVYGEGIKEVAFAVYNRWGEKVYDRTGDPFHGWDGTYKGELQQPMVYIYHIIVKYLDDKVVKKSGSVLLVR